MVTCYVKGSSVVNNEKENSAFSSLDVADEKENSAFSSDLIPTILLGASRVKCQYRTQAI